MRLLPSAELKNQAGKDRAPVWRCGDCCSMKSKLTRLKDSNYSVSISDIPTASRAEFVEKAKHMFGDDLKKMVTDTLTATVTQVSNIQMQCSAPFEELSKAKERHADQPEVWANILQNAEKFMCPVRQIEMIAIPNYTQLNTKSETETAERKRRCEQEMNIKKAARPKALPAPAEGSDVDVLLGQKLVPIPETKLEALTKILTDVKELGVKLVTKVAEAAAPELQQDMPKKQLANAEAIVNKFAGMEKKLNDTIEAKQAGKQFLTLLCKEAKSLTAEAKASSESRVAEGDLIQKL